VEDARLGIGAATSSFVLSYSTTDRLCAAARKLRPQQISFRLSFNQKKDEVSIVAEVCVKVANINV
jgi:hypothetical protein